MSALTSKAVAAAVEALTALGVEEFYIVVRDPETDEVATGSAGDSARLLTQAQEL